MSYRLIALDLDGTLHDRASGTPITDRTKNAIAQVRALGTGITIATGRMFNSTLPFCRTLGITMPIICFQGALVGDPVTEDIMWEKPIPLALAHRLITLIESNNLDPYVFVRDHFLVRQKDKKVEQYENTLKIEADPVGDLLVGVQQSPTKIVVTGNARLIEGMVVEIRRVFGSSLSTMKTYDHLCEIGHPGGSKGLALKRLAYKFGVERKEVIAVGDSPNDMDMIKWAGLGVAMGNATAEVQASADLITKPAANNGVACLLEDLLAEGNMGKLPY